MHFFANFKRKMADETLRDGNERGLYNFTESPLTLLIGIQNFNAPYVSADEYFEQANLRLEDAILILQLLYCTMFGKVRTVPLDFETMIKAVLIKVRFVFRVMAKYEDRNPIGATVSNSFACPLNLQVREDKPSSSKESRSSSYTNCISPG